MKPFIQLMTALALMVALAACNNKKNDEPVVEEQEETYEPMLTIRPRSLNIQKEKTEQLTALFYDENVEQIDDIQVRWETSDAAVATIDGDGLLTAVETGNAQITASVTYKGQTYSQVCEVKVYESAVTETDEYAYPDSDPKEGHYVYTVVEQQPQFVGGDEACTAFMEENVHYPVVAEEMGIQGRVVCQFIVHRNGILSDFEILRTPDESLGREVIRVLKLMPEWEPARQGGEKVCSYKTIMFTFRLQ